MCHLCISTSSEAVVGAIACELCEGCHHELPPAMVHRAFTSGLTRLQTGAQPGNEHALTSISCSIPAFEHCEDFMPTAANYGTSRAALASICLPPLRDSNELRPSEVSDPAFQKLIDFVNDRMLSCAAGPNPASQPMCDACQRALPLNQSKVEDG